MKYEYRTSGTCASKIVFDLEGDTISNVEFTGGCNGNLKAISSLVDGMKVDELEKRLRGIRCGFKKTSCSDQLAYAVTSAYKESQTK